MRVFHAFTPTGGLNLDLDAKYLYVGAHIERTPWDLGRRFTYVRFCPIPGVVLLVWWCAHKKDSYYLRPDIVSERNPCEIGVFERLVFKWRP